MEANRMCGWIWQWVFYETTLRLRRITTFLYIFLSYVGTIIIPYRNRQDHLDVFVQWIHSFLQAQNLSYLILLVEQTQDKKFNRAKLFNIGAIESKVFETKVRIRMYLKYVETLFLEIEDGNSSMLHLSWHWSFANECSKFVCLLKTTPASFIIHRHHEI